MAPDVRPPTSPHERLRATLRLTVIAAGAAALIWLTSCGSPGTPTASTTSTVSTSATSTTVMQAAVQPEAATSAADSEPVDIPITVGGDPALVNAPTTDPAAVLVVSHGSFDQLLVEIPIGGVVTFRSGDGSTHGIVVGDLSAVSVTGNGDEYYQFPVGGTFEVSDALSAATATIVVS